jgi:pimeloyl-ACP methyl ester carboxylesterase
LIEETTGATLVTYDRPGFGESEIDPEHHGFGDDLERLESGLKELGYGGTYTLVAHSLGGFYATMFASRHPGQVKAAVLTMSIWRAFTDELLESILSSEAHLQEYRRSDVARYYFSIDYEPMARTMRNVKFPEGVPVIDFVAGRRDFPNAEDGQRWKACHAAFAAESGNRTEITAYAGHYIYRSNPEMIVAAVNAAHLVTKGVRQPALLYAVTALNEVKRRDEQLAHSEDGLNQWGYDLLRSGSNKEAVKIFELNSVLHPSSWHVWDSLAEGYEALGDVA